jgi:hypothetical protein
MMTIIRDISFILALLLACGCLVSLFVYKRPDVSWLSFFSAGPMTIISPSRYLLASKAKIPPMLFALSMLLFVIVWLASWIAENPSHPP